MLINVKMPTIIGILTFITINKNCFSRKKPDVSPFKESRKKSQNCILLSYKGNNLEKKHAIVMVIVLDKSPEYAIQMYEVLLKYL